MPVQSLKRFGPKEAAIVQTGRNFRLMLARLFVFGGALALTAYGGFEMYKVVSISGTTFLQYVLLILFIANFSWIALAATSGLLGFASFAWRRLAPRAGAPTPIFGQTAIAMPVYNERTDRCFAAVGLHWRDHVRRKEGFRAEYPRLVSHPARLKGLGWSPHVGFDQLATMMMARARSA